MTVSHLYDFIDHQINIIFRNYNLAGLTLLSENILFYFVLFLLTSVYFIKQNGTKWCHPSTKLKKEDPENLRKEK